MKPNWLMMAVAIGVRQCYLPFKVRVRQWGGLPANRGATVLITNHQYVNEGEIVISRIFLTQPWKRLVMVNSRRTFETGFMAARLPWTAPFTRHLNPTGLWERFSILPVENHLFSRTLLSLAEEIRAAHGDLTLEDILPAERVAALGLSGRRLAELWSMACFFKAQATVKIAYLRDPYRREALEHFRATSAADIARIVETIRDGATFYVTPEGDFSRDGRMHRMRGGITEMVLPVAQPWFCAIAYDPFRGRRLGMLYRIVRVTDTTDLGTALAAARPLTTSALLASVLSERTEPLSVGAAIAAATAQLRALPSNVFVDPELARDVAGCIAEALTGLVGLGAARISDETYVLTDRRVDARLPHIADMIDYQKNVFEETLACARRRDESAATASASVTATATP